MVFLSSVLLIHYSHSDVNVLVFPAFSFGGLFNSKLLFVQGLWLLLPPHHILLLWPYWLMVTLCHNTMVLTGVLLEFSEVQELEGSKSSAGNDPEWLRGYWISWMILSFLGKLCYPAASLICTFRLLNMLAFWLQKCDPWNALGMLGSGSCPSVSFRISCLYASSST